MFRGVKVELSQAKVIVNVVEVEPCVMKLQLEMPAERADAIYRKVRKAVTSRVSLPGFRAGKMPPALIEKHFGRSEERRVGKEC